MRETIKDLLKSTVISIGMAMAILFNAAVPEFVQTVRAWRDILR